MRTTLLAACLFAISAFAPAPTRADTLAYPSPDAASFAVDYPSNWEMEPAAEVGDFVTLTGPTGVVVQIRTVPGTEAALGEAIEAGAEHLGEAFSDVVLDEPQAIEGEHPGSLVVGHGVNEDGAKVAFAMFYVAIPDGNIAEIWYAVEQGDEAGGKAAEAVLDSFRTR